MAPQMTLREEPGTGMGALRGEGTYSKCLRRGEVRLLCVPETTSHPVGLGPRVRGRWWS